MKKFRKNVSFVILAFILLACSFPALADDMKPRINQIVQNGNDVNLYVSLLDGSDSPVATSVSADQFTVSINGGSSLAPISATTSSASGEGAYFVFVVDISKSLTEDEMQQIRTALSTFVSELTSADYMQIITAGEGAETILSNPTCDANELNNAIEQSLQRTANYTYLYKAVSAALETRRKNADTLPERMAIIVISDGKDTSDNSVTYESIETDILETRVPLYVVGIKGNDSTASLEKISTLSSLSGGLVYSNDTSNGGGVSISEAIENIKTAVKGSAKLTVQPSEDSFNQRDLSWTVTWHSDSDSVTSSQYVFSLGARETVVETETETEPVTEVYTETEQINMVEEETAAESEHELTMVKKVNAFLKENLIICIAIALILVALIIILLSVLLHKRGNDFETEPSDELPYNNETLADPYFAYGNEETQDELDVFDDGKTVDEIEENGIRLRFEITFEGRTQTEERLLKEQLVLGRGTEGDIDVVLGSTSPDSKRISRHHTYIVNCADGLYVKDNLKNKTYLNGVEVTGENILRDEDILQMGKATVKVKILNY